MSRTDNKLNAQVVLMQTIHNLNGMKILLKTKAITYIVDNGQNSNKFQYLRTVSKRNMRTNKLFRKP